MKNRQISLYSYIGFLFIMYGVWHLTINQKKHGGYNIVGLTELITTLNNTIQPQLNVYIVSAFAQDDIEKFNSTLYKRFQEFTLNVQTIESRNQVQDQKNNIVIDFASYFFVHIFNIDNVVFLTEDLNDPDLLKNLRRFLNKFYPLVIEETQLESRQFYMNRLLIFDFFIIDKLNTSIMNDIQQGIMKLQNYFELPEENIKINYRYIKDILQIEDNVIELSKQKVQQQIENYQQIHSMNWKEYFQLNILTIITNEQTKINLDSNEDVQFYYQEPNNFLFHINNNASLYKNLFNSYITVLQIEEQQDIIFERLPDWKPTLKLVKEYFQKREYLRTIQNFMKELEYILFIYQEGEYKITRQSQEYFEQRLQYIKECVEKNQIYKTNTINILIDDSFSDLDTFSFEYTLGMYLPLILPFAYPILLSIYDELSSK